MAVPRVSNGVNDLKETEMAGSFVWFDRRPGGTFAVIADPTGAELAFWQPAAQ